MAETKEVIKTILVIDDDPDVRATLRIILESAGFTMGEAAEGTAGMKIAEKIRLDAIILDLMMETVDAGSKVSTKLKSAGFTCPIYLLSAAGIRCGTTSTPSSWDSQAFSKNQQIPRPSLQPSRRA